MVQNGTRGKHYILSAGCQKTLIVKQLPPPIILTSGYKCDHCSTGCKERSLISIIIAVEMHSRVTGWD